MTVRDFASQFNPLADDQFAREDFDPCAPQPGPSKARVPLYVWLIGAALWLAALAMYVAEYGWRFQL